MTVHDLFAVQFYNYIIFSTYIVIDSYTVCINYAIFRIIYKTKLKHKQPPKFDLELQTQNLSEMCLQSEPVCRTWLLIM